MPFFALGLNAALTRAATQLGFVAPTAIQARAIPVVLAGTDLQACAPTGSGKTAAFTLPLLQLLQDAPAQSPRPTRVLVLVPTRELASQVGEVIRSLAQELPRRQKIVVAFGGVSINPQMMALRGGADIVVATPGRLLDLVDHNSIRLGQVSTLVLDEADRLLDLGFSDELQRVLALLPAARQNLLFSATFAPGVQALADGLLRAPVRLELPATQADEPHISQRVIEVDPPRRTELLRHLITTESWRRALVFVATQHACGLVASKLATRGIAATPFHGGLSQGAREQALDDLKSGRCDIVVTTDLAARGLHIDQLPVVVNFDLPRSADQYVHRIGRTGRAGHSGVAVSFVSAHTESHFQLIEKRQGLCLPRERIAGFEPTVPPPLTPGPMAIPSAPGAGGIKGRRPSKKDKLRAAAALEAARAQRRGE